MLTMNTRRNWLKKIGLGAAGASLAPFEAIADTGKISRELSKLEGVTIELGLNENPYGPSPSARAEMAKHINMNRYERNVVSDLASELANYNQVGLKNILITAGSTIILDLTARLASQKKGNFVTAEPTFNYWGNMAQKLGMKKIAIPLTEAKKHNFPEMLNAMTPETHLVYVCNPNNPSGTLMDNEALAQFVDTASKTALVLVDEAYLEFTDEPSVGRLISDNKNVVVAKTFSKIHGLAGARVGYAIAHEALIKKLKQLQTWNGGDISTVSASGALASLKDTDFTTSVRRNIEDARTFTLQELKKLNITCIPSHTNFLYFTLKDYEKDYFQRLKNNNINGGRIYEQVGQWARISVGTMSEMKTFIKALQ